VAVETPDACSAGEECNRHGQFAGQPPGIAGSLGPVGECPIRTATGPLTQRFARSYRVRLASPTDLQHECGIVQARCASDGCNHIVAKTVSNSAATNLLPNAHTLLSNRKRPLMRHVVLIGRRGSMP
jgi:hypothetical protein